MPKQKRVLTLGHTLPNWYMLQTCNMHCFHTSTITTPPPPSASAALSKHGDPSDRYFPDFQRACARGRGGKMQFSSCGWQWPSDMMT